MSSTGRRVAGKCESDRVSPGPTTVMPEAESDWSHSPRPNAVHDVVLERAAQDSKWGEQNHPDGTGDPGDERLANLARAACDHAHRSGLGTWRHILDEEVCEALAESDPAKLRTELIQVAAVAVAWAEAIDRRAADR